MDYNEAIAILEEQYRTVSMCISSSDCLKHNKAIEMAVEALKKQISMKPNLKNDFDGWKFYTCPSCKIIRHDFDSYCDNCGQAIDRSEL